MNFGPLTPGRATVYRRGFAWLVPLVGIAVITLVWETLFRSQIVNLSFLPPPSRFIGSLIADRFQVTAGLQKSDIGQAAISSIARVTAGLTISFFLSLATGVLITRYRIAALLMPLIRMIAPIAPLAWVPLAIILFGLTEKSAVFIVFMGTYPALTIAAAAAIEQIPRDLLDVAATLGARGAKLWGFVILPSVLPSVFLMLRLNLIAAWMALLAGESVSLRNGLGGVVIVGRESVSPNMVMSGVALIAIVGLAMDQILLFVQSRLLWRRGAFTL